MVRARRASWIGARAKPGSEPTPTVGTDNGYDDVALYGDVDGEVVPHERGVRIRASGWVELPGGRLLSPDAVHRIDVRPA